MNEYLGDFQVKSMKEYVLTGMFPREQVEKERLQWEIKSDKKQDVIRRSMNGETVVTLTPMEFKTYRVELN